MDRFTFHKEYYEVIQRLKKPQDRALLSLALLEFIFEGKQPENLSEVAEMAFYLLSEKTSKSKNNSGRGGRPKKQNGFETVSKNKNRIKTELKPNCNTDLENENRFETKRETAPTEKERTKEKGITPERDKYLQERKKETDIDITSNLSARTSDCEESFDFSSMTDEELIAWGNGKSLDFDDINQMAAVYAWNEELEKRGQRMGNWVGKIVSTGKGLERLKSHIEVMEEWGASISLQNKLKEFLRQHLLIGDVTLSVASGRKFLAHALTPFKNDRFEGRTTLFIIVFCQCVGEE